MVRSNPGDEVVTAVFIGREWPECDFQDGRPAVYDGKTKRGPWAYMCECCFKREGTGLGLGRGQRLLRKEEDATQK